MNYIKTLTNCLDALNVIELKGYANIKTFTNVIEVLVAMREDMVKNENSKEEENPS